jgi:putative DNA primase/helicase
MNQYEKDQIIRDRFTFSDEEIAAGNGSAGLPELDAGDNDLAQITEATLAVLTAANNPPFIFRHADQISRIRMADDGTLTMRVMDDDSLRHVLARVADWYMQKKKRTFAAIPPRHVVRDILAHPEPPFPVITRIIRAPIFAADGTITVKPGYSPATRTYYAPAEDFDVAPVPQRPTAEDIEFARDTIADVLRDFPFVGESEHTHAVGLMILPFARELIDGPTPLHLIEKPAPGTGAGLLADVVVYPFLGTGAPVMAEGRDDDEWRKRITAKLKDANSIVLIDNVRKRIESSALSAAITCTIWEDRMLGQTAILRLPVKAVWLATGNNVALSNEIARRAVRIRLDAKMDRAWLRDGFKYPNLREYVLSERAKLIWCVLVLIQDWIIKGRPSGIKSIGTFEKWAAVVGGILENARFSDFLGNIEQLYEESDAEGIAWRQLVKSWWELHGDKQVGVGELYKIIVPTDGDALDIDLGDKGEQSQKSKLGKLLVQMRDRQFDGKRITKGDSYNNAARWWLNEVRGY